MKTYTIERFYTRNTATMGTIEAQTDAHACLQAALLSRRAHHVVVSDAPKGANVNRWRWSEYEKGKLVSWSHPNGLQG